MSKKGNYRKSSILLERTRKVESTEKHRVNIEQTSKLVRLKNQCQCWHRSPDRIMLSDSNNQEAVCRLCGKVINISYLNPADVKAAVATLDKVCDLAKMTINVDTDESRDIKLGELLSNFQFEMHRLIPDVAEAIVSKSNKRKQRSGSGPNDDLRRPMGPR